MNRKIAAGTMLVVCLALLVLPVQATAKQTNLLELLLNSILPQQQNDNIKILNPVSEPTLWGQWIVEFETKGAGELEIRAYDKTYFGKSIEFVGLYCGDEKINTENIFAVKGASDPWFEGIDNGKISVKNLDCEGTKGKLILRILETGHHHIEFSFAGEKAYAENFADCTGTLASPCHWCDTSNMTFRIRTNQSYSGQHSNMTYQSSAGTCGTTPEVNETWTYSLGYTYCPKEEKYIADLFAYVNGTGYSWEAFADVGTNGLAIFRENTSTTTTSAYSNNLTATSYVVGSDGGVSPYFGSYMLKYNGTYTGLGNAYAYHRIQVSGTDILDGYAISSDRDFLHFCVYAVSAGKECGMEINFAGTCSPLYLRFTHLDQDGYNIQESTGNPGMDGAWYCVYTNISDKVGCTIDYVSLVQENNYGSGTFTCYFDEIFISKYLYTVNWDTDGNWCNCKQGASGCNGLSCWGGTNAMSWESGTSQSCCGDDTEYYDYRNSYFGGSELWFATNTSDDACCNADDCVYGGTCYASGATYDLNSDSKKEAYCYTSGGQLVRNGGAEIGTTYNWTNFNGVTSADSNSGTYSFYIEGSTTVLSNEYIAIDPNKAFNLEGWFKSYGTGNSLLYFGYVPYDENKTQILHYEVDIYADTETTLYAACAAGDKIVRITDGTGWTTYAYAFMAFGIDDSGNYNDLPNRNLSNYNITRVQNMGSYWEVEFGTNVGKAAPAGTKVREHLSGGSYMYEAAVGASVPAAWTEYSATTEGENLYGCAAGKWWRGTKFTRIMMLANYAQSTDYKLRVDDVSLVSTQFNYTERWINTDYHSSYCTSGGYTWNIGAGEATGDSYAGTWGGLTSSNYCYNRSTTEGGSFVASKHCCCGDDNAENLNTENTYSRAIAFDNDQQACCDTGSDCVGGTTCYTAQSAGATNCSLNVGGNDNCSQCYNNAGSGQWLDCDQLDFMDYWCGNICGPKKGVIGSRDPGFNPNASWNAVEAGEASVGEYPDTSTLECCGDDASEVYLYRLAHSSMDNGFSTNTSDEACCTASGKCIKSETCYANGYVSGDTDSDGDNDYCNSGTWYDCSTNSQCLNGGTQYTCINNDCYFAVSGGTGTTCSGGSNYCLFIQNTTNVVARFDEFGYVDVKGTFSYSQSSLTPPAGSFMVKNSSATVLYIDKNGNLATRGLFYGKQSSITPSGNDFIVRNSTGTTMGYIDGANGNMYFMGDLHYSSSF